MITKITELTKTLLVAAGLLLGTSAWADPVYFGSSTKTLGPWDEGVLVSPDYTVVKGSTTTVYYTNETNTDESLTWQGYWNGVYEINGTGFWITTRADNVSGETWAITDFSWEKSYSDNFATMFTRDNMNGASVVLTISRDNDNKVEVLSTNTKGENTWWKKVTFTVPNDDNMVFRLRAENCYCTINSIISDKFVGPASNSATWWNNFSEYYTIGANKTLTLNFKNYSSKAETWNNFVTIITNDLDRGAAGYAEDVVLRTDNYGWSTKYDNNLFSNNYNWTTYKNDLDGADVELKIRRSDSKVAVKATYTTTAGNKYYQQYVYTTEISSSDPIRAFLTVDNSHIEGLTSSIDDTPDGAAEYLYTIKAVDGSDNDLQTFVTGAYWTGESAISVTYPMYILSGTTLYNIAANGSAPYYSQTFTPDAANYVGKLNYNNGTISNVVFYTEAEHISGYAAADNNACSNGQFARMNSDITLTSLQAGKYKIYGKFYSGNSSTSNVIVKAGGTKVWDTKVATGYAQSEDFILAEATNLTILCNGASSRGLDWVYIVKTGDATVSATMGTNGYTTFSSAYNLDLANLPAGVKAYTATLTETTLSFAECTKAVPAATGLLLAGDASTSYDIPVTAEAADAVTGNALIAAVTATSKQSDEDGMYYFVMKAGSDPLAFAPISTAKAVTIPAGKAYVELNTATGTGARSLTVTFGDDATGIQTVANVENATENYYNLSGQRVANPAKGLYIVNGKKVIIK